MIEIYYFGPVDVIRLDSDRHIKRKRDERTGQTVSVGEGRHPRENYEERAKKRNQRQRHILRETQRERETER